MLKISLHLKSNYKDESDESLDNPLTNFEIFQILFSFKTNFKDYSDESLDNPFPNF